MNDSRQKDMLEVVDSKNKGIILALFMLGKCDSEEIEGLKWTAGEKQSIKEILQWRINSRDNLIKELEDDLKKQRDRLEIENRFLQSLNTE